MTAGFGDGFNAVGSETPWWLTKEVRTRQKLGGLLSKFKC
jgi:hypothetical protein